MLIGLLPKPRVQISYVRWYTVKKKNSDGQAPGSFSAVQFLSIK